MKDVEWDDVQGLVLSGYPMLPASAYLLWRFLPGEPTAAKQWLQDLAERLTSADTSHEKKPQNTTDRTLKALKQASGEDLYAINLALTATGFAHLQAGTSALSDFSLEFQEGIAPKPADASEIPRRSNVLGDIGASSPQHWDWGGWAQNSQIDGVLLLYAADNESLDALVKSEIKAMKGVGEPIISSTPHTRGLPALEGRIYDDLKEHFGFTDGISQPMIEGSPKAKRVQDSAKRPGRNAPQTDEMSVDEQRLSFVKPGEFILGYVNERRANALNDVSHGENHGTTRNRDLRRNGTYLVFRQLEQDVPAFNDFVSKSAKRIYGSTEESTRHKFASLLVGRTLAGDPLVQTKSSGQSTRNDFLYYYEDRSGMACPIGAHIRRANPRDTVGPDPDTALRLSKMHRIIRRGRPYGDKLNAASIGSGGEDASRGMLFIALNADIAGQFEMIQHSWLNNTHFSGLYAGTDPFGHFECPADVVTIQNRPTNHYIERPRPFVRVRGGAYFFMPGINAVRALAA